MTGLIHRTTGRDPKQNGFCFAEVPDWQLRQWLDVVGAAASAIEAQRVETEGLDAEHESAVAKPDAQPLEPQKDTV